MSEITKGPGLLQGLCSRRGQLSAPRKNVNTCRRFRTNTALRVWIKVALTRWIRRVAFVGTAVLARPCGHAFFMFRFLARGSAGTDVSFTGRAGRGLALSRHNKRRAEDRRNNKSRDCKFGSHQKVS